MNNMLKQFLIGGLTWVAMAYLENIIDDIVR